MKKTYIVLLGIMCIFLCGCAKDDTLVMVTEAGFAPYEYYENKEIVGVDVEIAKKVAQKMGKKLEIKDVAFDSIINEVQKGKADFAAAGMSITEERQKQVDFSIEYATSKQVVIVKKNSTITDPNIIYTKKVGVQLGTVADLYLSEKMSDKNIVRQKKYLSLVEDLKANKVEAIVMDSLPANEILKTNQNLKMLDKELFEDKYGMVVKKGNTEMLNAINEVLEEVISNGQVDSWTIEYTK